MVLDKVRQQLKRLWADKRQPPPTPDLTAEQSELLRLYDKGMALKETVQSAGWQYVLDIFEEDVINAEYDLLNYGGVDREVLEALHRRARDNREQFEQIQLKIRDAILAAEQVPQAAAAPVGRPGATW